MREVDADNDGVISYEEFKNCMFNVLTKRASFLGHQQWVIIYHHSSDVTVVRAEIGSTQILIFR